MKKSPLAVLALVATLASFPTHALQRAFVSSTGSDANPCTPTAPCRSFAAAYTVVDAGGEILALDSAGYGTLDIGKSVTIIGNPGFYAGIAGVSALNNAVNVGAAGITVTLRGLTLNGTGSGVGVLLGAASTVNIENCVISNYSLAVRNTASGGVIRVIDSLLRKNVTALQMDNGASATVSGSKIVGGQSGIFVQSSPQVAFIFSVSDTVISDNSGIGVVAAACCSSGVGSLRMSITRSTIANNGTGLEVVSGFTDPLSVTLSTSSVVGNGTGVNNLGGTNVTVKSTGNNAIQENGTDVLGTLTAASLN